MPPRPPTEKVDFNDYAARYDETLAAALSTTGEGKEYFAERRMQRLAELFRQWGISLPEAVLDFGCGTGSATPFVAQWLRPKCLVGVDISEGSIDLARAQHGDIAGMTTKFVILGSEEADSAGPFDLAFCSGVFHHIAPEQRQQSLAWILRHLRPGALFALFENNPWNPGTRYVMKQCEFDGDAICLSIMETRRRLRAAGFEIIYAESLFFFPRILRGLRPTERYLRWLPFGGQYFCVGRKPLSHE